MKTISTKFKVIKDMPYDIGAINESYILIVAFGRDIYWILLL